VHQQVLAEISSVRIVAVEEKAKKTTAAIDGLLLARQERFVKLTNKMEEEKRAQQQAQAQRNPDGNIDQNQRTTQGGRYRGRRP
jgi:hypothetical protein